MFRRVPWALALPVTAALALTLTACGVQTPGGEPGGQAPAATGSEPDAADPIVVRIGEQEFPTTMAIYRRYEEAKGGPLELRAPLGPAREVEGGRVQEYTAGTVFWSPETGVHIVRGQILSTYLAGGGPTGWLGWPVTDETTEVIADADLADPDSAGSEVVYTGFQNGEIRLEDRAIRVVRFPG